jgi:hypothetical protein
MRILVLLLVFCFSAFVTFAQTRYENERYRFSIVSPDGFEVIRDYQPMIPVVFLSAPEDANDLFRENINVAVEPFTGSAEQYFNINLENMDKSMDGFKLIEKKNVSVNGNDAVRMVYLFDYEKSQKMKNVVYLFSVKGWGYAVTCSMLEDTFKKNEKSLTAIAETMQLEVK